jgi:hypothetical protein
MWRIYKKSDQVKDVILGFEVAICYPVDLRGRQRQGNVSRKGRRGLDTGQ